METITIHAVKHPVADHWELARIGPQGLERVIPAASLHDGIHDLLDQLLEGNNCRVRMTVTFQEER
jgi:hypothetical protein